MHTPNNTQIYEGSYREPGEDHSAQNSAAVVSQWIDTETSSH